MYADGSANHVGTPWAAGVSAAVQCDELGREREWASFLPEEFPISAVATEHMALTLCVLSVHKQRVQFEDTRTEREAIKRIRIAWL